MLDRVHCLRAGLLILCSLLVVACSRTIVGPELMRNPGASVEAAYIATDADFGRYARLTGAEMGIFFPTNSAIPQEDLDRMRQIFRETFLSELDGYTIVESAGPDVLQVDASLIDLRNALYNDIPNLRREVQPLAKPGALVFLMELKDSQAGTVLARAADSSLNPAIGTDDIEGSEWDAVETAAQHWASLFRQFLDQNLAN